MKIMTPEEEALLRLKMAELSAEIQKTTKKTKQPGPLVVTIGNKAFLTSNENLRQKISIGR